MAEHVETRWAAWNYQDKLLCGKFCWRNGALAPHGREASRVPTFRTRDLAWRAIVEMTSHGETSIPIKVTVTITTETE